MKAIPPTLQDDFSLQETLQRQKLYLAIFYTVLWPGIILLFIFTALYELDIHEQVPFLSIAWRIYMGFAFSYLIIQISQRALPLLFRDDRFWPQLVLHLLSVFIVIQLGGIFLDPISVFQTNQARAMPLVMIVSQFTLFVAVKTFLFQREIQFNTISVLQQSKINLLRSQSNPHFLFNTLNLLASEIPRNPSNAREIVYDLADLLREGMKAAEQKFISVSEEIRLVNLYLKLQQKRFPDRLDYVISIPDNCAQIEIPALLLQPLVENVVKHVVASCKQLTVVSVSASLKDEELVLTVSDNGPQREAGSVREGSGHRIVRETLELQYHGKAELVFKFSEEGGLVTITLPTQLGTEATRNEEHCLVD